ncbi:MAG TPA: hypothetical protein VD971_01900 [Phycisphaerales bacterium]|nr:hypothetical protein [Phycisphaerales bacterium]
MIPTKAHGVLDYLVGGFLILLGASQYGTTTPGMVLIVLGAGHIIYSLATAYELGIVKTIPMAVHLAIDAAGGVFLAASPWLLGFADRVWAPHLFLGLFEIVVVLLSSRAPGAVKATPAHSPA